MAAIKTRQVTVGTAPVLLTTQTTQWVDTHIKAPTAAEMFIGGPTVSSTTGFSIPAGATLRLELQGDDVYGVLASGSGTAYVAEIGIR